MLVATGTSLERRRIVYLNTRACVWVRERKARGMQAQTRRHRQRFRGCVEVVTENRMTDVQQVQP